MSDKRKASEDPTEPPRPTKDKRLSPSSTPQTTFKFAYPSRSTSVHATTPAFQRPTQIVSFSYDSTHTLRWDDSSLRYYVDPPRNADLNNAYERWVRKPEIRPRIDALLRAWSRTKKRMAETNPQALATGLGIGVMCWRGVMTRILTAPYEERDGWEMNVMLVNGTLYLEEHLTRSKLRDKEDMAPRQRKQTYYGYAFESYCARERPPNPRTGPSGTGWGGDVNTNEQWCSVVKTKLGDVRLIIGGEVDCVRDKYTSNTDTFVELKTSLVIRNSGDEARFEKKLLKFYFQSFLLGVPEIVVGFRHPSGHLSTLQSFDTTALPRLVRGKPDAWDPAICLAWGERFLTFLRSSISSATSSIYGTHADDVKVTDKSALPGERAVWRVRFAPKEGVSLELLSEDAVKDVESWDEDTPDGSEAASASESRVGFLPEWYWEELCAESRFQPSQSAGQGTELYTSAKRGSDAGPSSGSAKGQRDGGAEEVTVNGKIPVKIPAGWQI